MLKPIKDNEVTCGMITGAIAVGALLLCHFGNCRVNCDLVAVYPERDRVALEVEMPNEEVHEYWVDYYYPIPDDANTVAFSTWIWNKGDYTTYSVDSVYER